jgi:hypothetical protein
MSIRPVKKLITSKPTLEGAGVHLRRAFGFGQTSDYDPFLLLDDFRSDVPEDYLAGFPWHPHRGIETITYVVAIENSICDRLCRLARRERQAHRDLTRVDGDSDARACDMATWRQGRAPSTPLAIVARWIEPAGTVSRGRLRGGAYVAMVQAVHL